jgi:hypothetical protein
METREDSPGRQFSRILVQTLNCSQLTHPADLRARRERARARRVRAVHVIFQNSKFKINSGVSPPYVYLGTKFSMYYSYTKFSIDILHARPQTTEHFCSKHVFSRVLV